MKTMTAKLVIQHAENGEPLPSLEITIGDETYHLLDGKPVPGWTPGCVTERIANAVLP